MTTGHTLTIAATTGTTTVTARCSCGDWTLVTPDPRTVNDLYALHVNETRT